MRWAWLFDLEAYLLGKEYPLTGEHFPFSVRIRFWGELRRPVSLLTRRIERRGRMF